MPLSLHTDDLALLVIDMQNGMCDPRGTLGISGVDMTQLQAIVPRVKRLIELCRAHDVPDIWSLQHHYREDATREAHRIQPHTLKRTRIACEAGTWDAEIVDELKPLAPPESRLIVKHKFSAFYATRLEVLLRILGRRTLIVCGTTSNACVDTTIREAYMRDFDLIMVEDCIAGVDQSLHDAAVRVWSRYMGEVVRLEDLPSMLGTLTGSDRSVTQSATT